MTRTITRALRMSFLLPLLVVGFIFSPGSAGAAVLDSYNVNTAGDLAGYFNADAGGTYTELIDGGIENSGAVNTDGLEGLYVAKDGYLPLNTGETLTVSAYFYNDGSDGYGALGFVDASPSNHSQAIPNGSNAMTFRFNGSGGSYYANTTEAALTDWAPSLEAGTWYRAVFSLTKEATADSYAAELEIWKADASGNLLSKIIDAPVEGFVNANLAGQTLYPFFATSGLDRIAKVDTIEITDEIFNGVPSPLGGSGTAEDPYQLTQCYTITESGYYELQNSITGVIGDCIVIQANDVFIDGADFTISSDGQQENQAIVALGYDRISITDVTIDAFYDGIMLHDSAGDSVIDNVTITNSSDDAIDLHGTTDITISNSTITGASDDGIEVVAYDNMTDGIFVSRDVTINNVTISGVQDAGIEARAIEGLTITNNTITSDGDGINLSSEYDTYQIGTIYSNTITISTNTISNTDDAIVLRYINGATIQNNQISNSDSDAIYVVTGSDVVVTGNTITGTGSDGIDFSYDDSEEINENITITNNTMTGIGDNGIELERIEGATITGNSIQTTDNGIQIDESEDIIATNNTIAPASETYQVIPADSYNFTTLDINDAEDSITDSDDDSFTYTLPFTFNFMGRSITDIEVSTNGAIELLTDGEGCEICDEYGLYSNYFDNDVIFSSFDDLDTSGGYVAVFDLDDEGGERVVVEFYGRTHDDDDTEVTPIHFQTVLYPNGQVEWHFKEMKFEDYDSEMFTGVYDYESETLYQAGKFIDGEEVAYAGDFSGAGSFTTAEGFAANTGIDLGQVVNSSFIGNTIRASQWVYAQDLENVVFNDNDSGNTYRLLNGNGAWTIFDITDSDANGYADGGTDRPFSEATVGSSYWEGEGQDAYPATITTATATTPTVSVGQYLTPESRSRAKKVFDDYYAEKNKAVENSNSKNESEKTLSTCPADQLLTQNLRAPSRNGRFNSYTKGIVREAKILQAHLNRLGFNSGPVDGILGRLSDGAIKRMQTFLGTKADGFVGPKTRALINNSCGDRGLQKTL